MLTTPRPARPSALRQRDLRLPWHRLLPHRRQQLPLHRPQPGNNKKRTAGAPAVLFLLPFGNLLFSSSIKCWAPSCVSSSPVLSGTSAFWHSILSSSRCASVIIGSSMNRFLLASGSDQRPSFPDVPPAVPRGTSLCLQGGDPLLNHRSGAACPFKMLPLSHEHRLHAGKRVEVRRISTRWQWPLAR